MVGIGDIKHEDYEVEGDAFGGDLFVGYDFGLFTGQLEFLITNDKIDVLGSKRAYNSYIGAWETVVDYNSSATYSGTLLQIPLIVKMDLHLWRFVLQPLAGIYLNFGLGNMNKSSSSGSGFSSDAEWENPLLGWVAGGTLGFRLGRGFIFGDMRFKGDISKTNPFGGDYGYTRSGTLFSLGYQYYFRQR
jgi:hypothetical protein